MPTASLIVRAPISAAARAGPRPRITSVRAIPEPGRERVGELCVAQRSLDRCGREIGAAAEPVNHRDRRCTRDHASDRRHRDQRPRERHGGGARLGPDPGVEGDVGHPAQRVHVTVRDGDHDGRGCGVAVDGLQRPDHLRALTGLAHGDQQRGRPDHAGPEVEQFGGVQHHGGDARPSELGDGRVAGVVGAAHPGEHHGSVRGECRDVGERRWLVREPLGRPPQRIGLPRDLRDEWVRKLS